MDDPVSPEGRRPVLLIFALTGASALIYQVIWARQLGLVFGNTTTSVSIVLSTFMAGLALGSWIAGKYLVQSGNPLRRYAIFEGCIGLYAVLFGPLVKLFESLYPALLSDDAGVLTLTIWRALGSFALLIVPTTLMGATLPLTTEYLHRLSSDHRNWNAGKLYAANTFGAAAGSFASGFLLIEILGIQATTLLAAAFNLTVMLIGLRLSRTLPDCGEAAPGAATAEPPPAAESAIPLNTGYRRYLGLLACTGALALAGEVIWTRLLTLLMGNSTYAFSGMLIAYLTGIALGSWFMSSRVPGTRDFNLLLCVCLLASAAWYSLSVSLVSPLYDWGFALRDLPAGAPMAGLRYLGYFAAVLGLLMPAAALSGALFPAVTRCIGTGTSGDRGAPVARAYLWNTTGCIAGSLIAGFVIVPSVTHFHAAYVVAAIAATISFVAAFVFSTPESRRTSAGFAAMSIALAAWAAWSLNGEDGFIQLMKKPAKNIEISFHRPGIQGVTTVAYLKGHKKQTELLLVDGHGMTAKVFATKAMAHIPLGIHGGAGDTLVICFGMGTTFRSALTYGGKVDVVELVPQVFEAFPEFFDDAAAVRTNPNGRMIANDGRNFLLLADKKYDVVTIDPPPPIDAAGVNNLYSLEFVQLMRDHLKPGGLAAHWIPDISPATGVFDIITAMRLVATFKAVFPHVRILKGRVGIHLIGSMTPFQIDLAKIQELQAKPEIQRDLGEFSWDPYDPAVLQSEIQFDDKELATLELLTDDHPVVEFNLLKNIMSGEFRYMFRIAP